MFKYTIHVNEEDVYEVKAPDVDSAFLQAMALHHKQNPLPKPSTESFEHYEIYIENTTQFKAFQDALRAKGVAAEKAQMEQ